ncbi:unnamed protein product [Cuscuta europaea]|uniref:Uncharacterized protein n=1 Tax=Cuscuta europaea TaxID=41803 RepID=A0A9P1E7N4_CUSEU|nr:unnamed protein product [Cuscuta europaea]
MKLVFRNLFLLVLLTLSVGEIKREHMYVNGEAAVGAPPPVAPGPPSPPQDSSCFKKKMPSVNVGCNPGNPEGCATACSNTQSAWKALCEPDQSTTPNGQYAGNLACHCAESCQCGSSPDCTNPVNIPANATTPGSGSISISTQAPTLLLLLTYIINIPLLY